MDHQLKTQNPYFRDIVSGKKNFEVRLNDRNYKVGDTLTLQEFIDPTNQLTGEKIIKEVIYIMDLTAIMDITNHPFWSDEEIEKHGIVLLGLKDPETKTVKPNLKEYNSKLVEKFEITWMNDEEICFDATFYSSYYKKSFTCEFTLLKEIEEIKGEQIISCKRDWMKGELDEDSPYDLFDEVVPYEELLANFGLQTESWSSDSDQDSFIMLMKVVGISYLIK